MKRYRYLILALLASTPAIGQDDAMDSLLKSTRATDLARPASQQGISIHPSVLRGLGTVKIFAYLRYTDSLHSTQIFPMPTSGMFKVPRIKRIAWENESRLGPLHLRTSIHYDEGSQHIEGSVLFLNSESNNPVGDVQGEFALGVDDGLGVFAGRSAKAFGLEPIYVPNDPNLSLWRLSYTRHIRGANMVPFPFVINFGSAEYGTKVYNEPDHIRLKGEFLIPSPIFDESHIRYRRSQAKAAWEQFQNDTGARTNPGYIFHESPSTGASGSQPRLGKHPCMDVVSSLVASGYASDHLRSKTMWVEGRRKYWLDWPKHPARHPGSGYNFYGLHWTSKWKAGYVFDNTTRSWITPWGDDHGVSGYNLEHLRSRLPEMAYFTQDPQLMWMTRKLGYLIYCSLVTEGIPQGGYFGGAFSSLRGWTRPLVELYEVIVALESYGDVYREDVTFLLEHATSKTEELWTKYPRFPHYPTRPDELIPGHEGEPITELWQTGIGGDYFYAWWLLKHDRNAFELARQSQQIHIEGWRGATAATVEMPKQVLQSDWSIGRAYHRRHDFLVGWNVSLLAIKGIEGIDQQLLDIRHNAVLMEYPQAPWTTWGYGDWANFRPTTVVENFPWYMPN